MELFEDLKRYYFILPTTIYPNKYQLKIPTKNLISSIPEFPPSTYRYNLSEFESRTADLHRER